MKPTVKKLTKKWQKEWFLEAFYHASGFEIETSYLNNKRADTYALFYKGDIVGGFVLIKSWPFGVIRQIPSESGKPSDNFSLRLVNELTCYFINHPELGFKLTLALLVAIVTSRAKWFIYSYETKKRHLERYYSAGKPIRFYSGPVLDRATGYQTFLKEHENVEILSKVGILRIFLSRNFKMFKEYLR